MDGMTYLRLRGDDGSAMERLVRQVWLLGENKTILIFTFSEEILTGASAKLKATGPSLFPSLYDILVCRQDSYLVLSHKFCIHLKIVVFA